MVRLGAELISRAPQYLNAVKDREIDLRGNKIAAIENLGVTADQYDSIDLSDNEIVKLDGFPELRRLSTLLISNNRISRISSSLGEFLPKLHTLVLTNNRLGNLAELDPLASLVKLHTLSLLENVVTKLPEYRLYVIHKLPNLRLLDFSKVKAKEKIAAKARFASQEAEENAKKGGAEQTFVPGEVPAAVEPASDAKHQHLSRTALKAAIQNAQTLAEVARLERALATGQYNGSGDAMEEG
ncbi:U2 small nuclear ribonucleoprotein A' isoform X3 [Selaginella moellendorffii]|nr:U2 small nuclear ribonucleoprotein A' isoform X3 [Selaginella moellendorffii]|eukprot:XP_002992324.2 U2 small nuclear ribonucleoprotein A' isoform X3 [Selaginella moellendorffii]